MCIRDSIRQIEANALGKLRGMMTPEPVSA
jgi:DNA-directed RNA polymerase sigma subunit (sigma70/sigma32)